MKLEQRTARPRVRPSLIERVRAIKLRPPYVVTDEEVVEWALFTFAAEHAPPKEKPCGTKT